MFEFVKDSLKGFADSVLMTYDQNKPSIMIFGGAVGLIVAGVCACIATAKAKDELDETKKVLDDISEKEEKEEITKEAATKAKAEVGRKTVGKIVLYYIMPIALAVLSFLVIRAGVKEETTRIDKLQAALIAETARSQKILERVEKMYGKEGLDKVLYDIHEEEVEEEVTDPKTGEKKTQTVKKTVAGEDLSGGERIVLNEYTCPTWFVKWNYEYNLSQLKAFENALNADILRKQEAFNGTIMTADDVMRYLEYKPAEDTEWKIAHKDVGYRSTPDNQAIICLGLKEARRLIEFGICDKEEIVLHINWQHNIWTKG